MINDCFITADCQKVRLGVDSQDLAKYFVSVLQRASHRVVQVIHNLEKKHISNVNFYKHNIQIRPNYLRRMENPGKPVVIYLLRPLQCLALQSQYPKGKPARKMVSTRIRTLFLIISYKFRFLTSCMACSSMLILLLSGTLSVLFCTEQSNINCVTI